MQRILVYKMNFKIQQTYPNPTHGLANYNTLTYAEAISSVILYGEQKNSSDSSSQAQPKKKIAFKVDKSAAAPTVDKISIFSIAQRNWLVKQAKGKIPTARSQFKSVYMKPCMIIYGGKSNGKFLNDVYALNCETWVWKKLFSLDGPTLSQQFMFFKISDLTAGLIVSRSLWLLQLADVKWQLSANQLPGSVWERLNITLPQKILFTFPINEQILMVVGEEKGIKINIRQRQNISQFDFDSQNQLKSLYLQDKITIQCMFNDMLMIEQSSSIPINYLVSQHNICPIGFKSKPSDSLIVIPQQSGPLNMERHIKCCAYVSRDNRHKQIYYLDSKGEFISIDIKLNTQAIEDLFKDENQLQNTTRKIEGADEGEPQIQVEEEFGNNLLRDNSCILEEEENQQSSVLVPSSNSRIKLQNNSRVELLNLDNQNDLNYGNQQQQQQQMQNVQSPIWNSKMTVVGENQPINYTGYDKKNKGQQGRNQNRQKQRRPQIQVATKSIKRNIYNINSSQTNPPQRSQNEQRFKHKTQQHMHTEKQSHRTRKGNIPDHQLQAQVSGTAQQVKQRLENILYNQSIKRKLLQAKCHALQSIIKKSEKFVLMLCKYGNNADKIKHIDRVKEIRHELQWNWNKEVYYKKEMEGNKMPSQISQQIQKTMSHIQY